MSSLRVLVREASPEAEVIEVLYDAVYVILKIGEVERSIAVHDVKALIRALEFTLQEIHLR